MGINVTDSDGSKVENSMIYAAGSGGINLHGKSNSSSVIKASQ
jgi:hypothetical protein